MSYLIGLDIGTSAVKCGLFDVQGKLLASARSPQCCYSPHPGWAEQDPLDWWRGSLKTLQQVLSGIKPEKVIAVGLSGQCPSHVLLNARQEPLGRAIIWRDQRALEESRWIKSHISKKEMLRWTGVSQLDDPGMTPARLLWLKGQLLEEWHKTWVVVQPKDFIGLRLTGELATDPHTAFCLINPETIAYSKELLDKLGISLSLLPPLRLPTDVLGKISPSAASITGLRSGTPVIVGTIDAYCDSLAGGAAWPGRAVDIAGTSEIVSLGVEQETEGKGVFLVTIDKQSRFLCGPSQAGGGTLHWLAQYLFPDLPVEQAIAELEKEAKTAEAGCNGLIFLPYLSGERAPIWDKKARGIFWGVTITHDRRHLARAVYEGVAFVVRHILETCEASVGHKADQVVVCGGASASQFWNLIKANVLGRPIIPTQIVETGSLGSAILAATGIGLYPTLRAACQEMVRLGKEIHPNSAAVDICQTNYERYRKLYPALRSVLHIGSTKHIVEKDRHAQS